MKKVKRLLIGLSIPAAAFAMSIGTVASTPETIVAGPGGGFDCASDCNIVCGKPETPCSLYLCDGTTYTCFGPI